MSFSGGEVNGVAPLPTRRRTVNDDGGDCFTDARGNTTSDARRGPSRSAEIVYATKSGSGEQACRAHGAGRDGLRPVAGDDAAGARRTQGIAAGDRRHGGGDPDRHDQSNARRGRDDLGSGARGDPISDADRQQLFTAAINVLASPPSLSPLFAVAYAVTDRIEVGLRYAGQGWRLGGRYQPLRHEDGPFDLVVGLGVARSAYKIPIAEFIPVVEVDDFTRWTFDVPVTVGTSRSWFRVWIGPKLVYSRFDTAIRLVIPNELPEIASFDGHSTFIGGVGGLALGYRNLFFGIELTVGQLSGSTDTALSTAGVLRSAELGGTVVYPAFGLMGEI